MSSAAHVAATTPAVSPPTGEAGAYQARRSNKTAHTTIAADGAVWKERLAVCEGVTDDGLPKLTVRSYYRNQHTLERVWDEPPSGASEIIFATSEQRKKADLQKQEMQLTLDELPPDLVQESQHSSSSGSGGQSSLASSGGGGGSADKKTKGSFFGRFRKQKERPTLQDDSKDLNLQRAIALSVAEANGKVPFASDPVILYDNEGGTMRRRDDDDEDVALAKALSMSATTTEALQPSGLTDEELLQQALEASRRLQDSSSLKAPPATSSSSSNYFDPYAPGATTRKASQANASSSVNNIATRPPKMESDEGKKKPGRSMKRRVMGRKTMANQAGVV